MKFEEFQQFINDQHNLFRSLRIHNQTEREDILARTVKLSEEFGELSDEVLASMEFQRKGKLEERDPHGLADEFADVVIVTFLLARAMDMIFLPHLHERPRRLRQSTISSSVHKSS